MMKTNIYTTFAKSINLHTRSMKLRRRFDISNYAIPLSCVRLRPSYIYQNMMDDGNITFNYYIDVEINGT